MLEGLLCDVLPGYGSGTMDSAAGVEEIWCPSFERKVAFCVDRLIKCNTRVVQILRYLVTYFLSVRLMINRSVD